MHYLKSTILILLVLALTVSASEGQFPDFKSKDIEGNDFALAEFLADGPIIMTFWATWCKPCLKELGKLTEMEEFLNDHGVRVLAVNTDGPRTRGKAKPFASKNGWDFTIIFDTDGSIKTLAGVAEIPEMFILSTEGKIMHHHVGYKPGDEVEYKEQIEALFPIDVLEKSVPEDDVAQ